jgi:hypothetical protein
MASAMVVLSELAESRSAAPSISNPTRKCSGLEVLSLKADLEQEIRSFTGQATVWAAP